MAIIREESSNSSRSVQLPPAAISADKNDVARLDVSGSDIGALTVMIEAVNVALDDAEHLQISLAHSDDNVDFVNCQDSEVVGNQLGSLLIGTFADFDMAPTGETAFSASYISAMSKQLSKWLAILAQE